MRIGGFEFPAHDLFDGTNSLLCPSREEIRAGEDDQTDKFVPVR
jgi:hypothetical protein